MTNAEARRYILENWFDGDENADAVVGGGTETMAMKLAVRALEIAGENEKTKRKSCFDCKHGFISGLCYLECDYFGIMNNSEICERFEEKEK